MEINFATFNVDQARREENYENTKWDNRCQGVVELINNSGADIICLQELRNLATSKINVKQFLNILNYDYEYVYYCEFERSFAMAILYDRSKYYVVESNRFNYHGEPSNDKICFGLKFRIVGSDRTFWVYNTHFDLPEDRKWESVDRLIKTFGNFKEPIVIAGDYNFFNDRDGIQQRNKMREYFKDFAHPLEDLSGTFIGFEHDEFKRSFEDMSRLDHIFTRHVAKTGVARGVGWTKKQLCDRTYPSDHIMVKVSFEV